MKVTIDISPLKNAHQHRGIGTYTRQLIKSLHKIDSENQFTLTTKPEEANADLIHYPYFDLFFKTLPFFQQLPTVVTVHDVIPLIFPKQYPPGIKGSINSRLQKLSLQKAAAIITDSEQSKRDIHHYLNIPLPKIYPIYLAVSDQFQPASQKSIQNVQTKYGIGTKYILYVGDINYSKNVPGLIRAVAAAQTGCELVLVSKALENDIPEAREIRSIIASLQNQLKVHVLTNVPQDPSTDLIALYSGAWWYIQPSFYEGFGLPVLEAMKCGAPVISSTGGSLKEVVGDAALHFDPTSEKNTIDTIKSAMKLRNFERKAYQEKGQQRVAQFSWLKTAQKTRQVYQKVLNEQ